MTETNKPNRNKSDKIVLLRSFYSAVDAAMTCGMLRDNGIDAILDNETINMVLPLGFNKVRLMVWQSQYDEALKLLDSHGDD